MGLRKFATACVVTILFWSCNNLERTDPTERTTFIHFYEKAINYSGITAEALSDGFLVAGNLDTPDEKSAVIFKTDLNGNIVWETTIPNGATRAIKTVEDGYLILGDSIEIDNEATQVADREITKLRLIKMNLDGQILLENNLFDPNSLKVDFHGDAINLDNNGDIIAVGNFQPAGSFVRSLVAAFDPSTLDTLWTQSYSLIDRDYSNSKSTFVNSSNRIIWASAAQVILPNNNRSYLTVPAVEPNSTFVNSDLFGESENLFYDAADMTQSGIGFGVIGTFSNAQGQNANVYFLRVDPTGNIISGSERFFDGVLTDENPELDRAESATQDSGESLASTADGGYILAGTMSTTTDKGNGGTDIFLIRVDPFGNLLWNKILGGSGDERPSSITVLDDGGYLICGSVTLNGLTSLFLIRTDNNGELEK